MTKQTATALLLVLGAGCAADQADDFEMSLRDHAASLGHDPDAASFDGEYLTMEGDMQIGFEHVEPEADLDYDLQGVLEGPQGEIERVAADAFAVGTGDAVKKGRFYKDPSSGRVYNNNPWVNEVKVCYWGNNIGLHIFNLAGAANMLNAISGTGLKIKVVDAKSKCTQADGYQVEVRMYTDTTSDRACALGALPRRVAFAGGYWVIPGNSIQINTVPPPTGLVCPPPKATMAHEILHTLGFGHSNETTYANGTRNSVRIDGTANTTTNSIMSTTGTHASVTWDDTLSIREVYPD